MPRLPLASLRWLALGASLGACQPPQPEVPEDMTTGAAGSSSGSTSALGSTSGVGSTSVASSSASGDGTSTTSVADSTGSDSGTTVALEDSGSSTGEPSSVGCADGEREALADEVAYPNIAACAGGFWIPGVNQGTPVCDRQGGDDGLFPGGMGCSIDDLCGWGWHLCADRHEVMTLGIGSCGGLGWNDGFYATGQSGNGSNDCDDSGTNDVFGCGDLGHTKIGGCAPLNRSTGDLCGELIDPWSCDDDRYDEASYLIKTGPGSGGALCCRDVPV